jgi:hypothetical protein
MPSIAQEDFTSNLFILLKETFEGPPPGMPSACLDQGGGLFQRLEEITAEDASRPVRTGATTIAAHCAHVRFYIDVLYGFMRGAEGKVDWNQSWLVTTVDPGEWQLLKTELRRAYQTVLTHLESTVEWGDTPIGEAMAIIVHTAYHLGSIRQMMVMKASTS